MPQLLSGFLANVNLPRVSRQSANDKGWKWDDTGDCKQISDIRYSDGSKIRTHRFIFGVTSGKWVVRNKIRKTQGIKKISVHHRYYSDGTKIRTHMFIFGVTLRKWVIRMTKQCSHFGEKLFNSSSEWDVRRIIGITSYKQFIRLRIKSSGVSRSIWVWGNDSHTKTVMIPPSTCMKVCIMHDVATSIGQWLTFMFLNSKLPQLRPWPKNILFHVQHSQKRILSDTKTKDGRIA